MRDDDDYDFECEVFMDDGGAPPDPGTFDASFDATFG